VDIVHGIADDPNPTFRGERQRVAVNRRTDALESEYSYGRLSEGAYRAGRIYQSVLECASGSPSGGGQWMEGDRVDVVIAHELAILRGIDRADAVVVMLDDTCRVVGKLGQRVLALVLVDRLTLEQVAERVANRKDKLARSFYAETFRQSLEALADHWSSAHASWPRA
jgi:hypothetical protein